MNKSLKMPIAFRVFPEGDVIAIFQGEVCDPHGNVMSFQHIGQHGAASPDLIHELREAIPEEYAALLRELKGIYKPKRITRSGVPGDAVIFHGVENE